MASSTVEKFKGHEVELRQVEKTVFKALSVSSRLRYQSAARANVVRIALRD
jgi:hypothetical protein